MKDKKQFAVIIPSRGGSKRFPGKNIYPLRGRPLLSYPIQAALGSKYVDRIIVSTDNAEIATIAKHYGAEVPFMRPGNIAGDSSPVIETMRHAVGFLNKEEAYKPDYVILLQPTTPLVTSEQIDKAIELAAEKSADSVVTVSLVDTIRHPYNIREILDDGTVKFWQHDLHYQCLQKDKKKFYYAANLWLSSYKTITEDGKLEGARNFPLIVESIYAMDIDYKNDLELVEAWLQYKNIKNCY